MACKGAASSAPLRSRARRSVPDSLARHGRRKTLTCQPHPVAGSAEFAVHGSDQPNAAAPAGRRIIHRRPIAKGRTGHRLQLRPAAVKALQQFRAGKAGQPGTKANGHHLDKAHLQRMLLCEGSKGFPARPRSRRAAAHSSADRQPLARGRPDAVCTAASSSLPVMPEGLRVQGVKADVHAVKARRQQGGQLWASSTPLVVGATRRMPGMAFQARRQLFHAPAHQRFTAGDAHRVDAALGEQRSQPQKFLIGQNIFVGQLFWRRPAYSSGSAGCTGR